MSSQRGDERAPAPISDPNWIASSTLEVRWVLPGLLDEGMVRWFGRLSPRTEQRHDLYLVSPQVQGLSLKIRGGARLEVKVRERDAGIFDLPGRARGGMEYWRKWSFPLASQSEVAPTSVDWRRVGKRRRVSSFSASALHRLARLPDEDGCTVELTEIVLGSHAWWTLGFEAYGPPDGLQRTLEATARLVFSEAPPGGLQLRAEDALSYSEWLRSEGILEATQVSS